MKKKPIILVVDDEERNRIMLEDILSPQGYSVILAENGAQALDLVTEMHPDVILLDMRMPEMDGLEVIRRLKSDKSTKLIPIVIVTGMSDMTLRIEALKLGADDFLLKPPHMEELKARVRSLVKVSAYYEYMDNYQKKLKRAVAARTRELKKALEALEMTHERLRESSLDTIFHLSKAAEYKDEDTSAHLQRISRYVGIVARHLGLDAQTVDSFVYASPMHDVGKIGIPDNILVKPGALTDEEWEIMRQHTDFGGAILEDSSSEFIKLGKTIALTHHEKWDGTGYPVGLKGKEIPLEGRITAIADVFDALSSRRPYKEPFSLEKSLGILREEKGRHFDPLVVDAFFEGESEILEVLNSYREESMSRLYQLSAKINF